MATYYGSTYTAAKSGALPQQSPDGRKVGAKERRIVEVFDLESQPIGDKLFFGTLPAGAAFAGVRLDTDTSLGASTLAVGSAASAAKYKAAGTFTALDTPTMYGKASAMAQAPLEAPEDVFGTIAAAALPASGTLVTELFYTTSA
ncbi:MAG TPA: hypothetical protein VGW34_10000 [Allosphingosinicella sp.]|nr:hypothetical protein [Allosphingosinicella sp.]